MMMPVMKGKKPWMITGAVILFVGMVVYAMKSGGVSAEVYKVSSGEIKQYVEETAQAVPLEKQTVYADGSGKVTDIRVDVGDTVKRGQLLLSLDKTELQLQLRDAEAKIEAAKAQLKGTDLSNYANKIEMARADVNQAQIAYTSAQRNYDNAVALYDSQAISQDQLEKSRDEVKKARAAMDSANLKLADIKGGTPGYEKTGYRAQLEQAVIHRDTILRSLQKQDLRAEIDGVVIERLLEKNSPAAPATAAFVIGNLHGLELEAEILADDIHLIKVGNLMKISGKSIGDAVLTGKVVKIAPAAKTTASNLGINQKRVTVNIGITGDTGALKPGYNVEVKIITAVKNNVLKVPDTSVFEYQGKNHVFVVENGKAILRKVEKGIESGNFIEIRAGLKAGETILVKPDNKITEGAKIKPLALEQRGK